MSFAYRLQSVGWKGNTNHASNRFQYLSVAHEIYNKTECKISGSFPLLMYYEHHPELNMKTFYCNDIDIFIPSSTKMDFIDSIMNDISVTCSITQVDEDYMKYPQLKNAISSYIDPRPLIYSAYRQSCHKPCASFSSKKYMIDEQMHVNIIQCDDFENFQKYFDFTICSVIMEFGNNMLDYSFTMSDDVKEHVDDKKIVPSPYCLSSVSSCVEMKDVQSYFNEETDNDYIITKALFRFNKYRKRGFVLDDGYALLCIKEQIEQHKKYLDELLTFANMLEKTVK